MLQAQEVEDAAQHTFMAQLLGFPPESDTPPASEATAPAAPEIAHKNGQPEAAAGPADNAAAGPVGDDALDEGQQLVSPEATSEAAAAAEEPRSPWQAQRQAHERRRLSRSLSTFGARCLCAMQLLWHQWQKAWRARPAEAALEGACNAH